MGKRATKVVTTIGRTIDDARSFEQFRLAYEQGGAQARLLLETEHADWQKREERLTKEIADLRNKFIEQAEKHEERLRAKDKAHDEQLRDRDERITKLTDQNLRLADKIESAGLSAAFLNLQKAQTDIAQEQVRNTSKVIDRGFEMVKEYAPHLPKLLGGGDTVAEAADSGDPSDEACVVRVVTKIGEHSEIERQIRDLAGEKDWSGAMRFFIKVSSGRASKAVPNSG